MHIVVSGSRSITDENLIKFALERSGFFDRSLESDYVVHGDCPLGVDRIAASVAFDLWGCQPKPYPADWVKYGKGAGHRRNSEMAAEGDCLVAIWDGVSPGTKNMVEHMKKRKKPYHLMIFQEESYPPKSSVALDF